MQDTRVVVRQAEPRDAGAILDFFQLVRRRYMTFGGEDVPRLLRTGHVFLAQTGPLIWGVLVIAGDRLPWGQIKALGLIDGWGARTGIDMLLAHARETLVKAGVRDLFCVLTEPWLQGPLERIGFNVIDRVVTLLRQAHTMPPVPKGPASLRVILPEELEAVVRVDAAAFSPQWRYVSGDLVQMLATGCRIVVARMEGEIVGYCCVETQGEVGHIGRLAVHPRWQGQGIGRQLLLDAMHYLRDTGAVRLSLNTQMSNKGALRLYESLRFRRFGRAYPVLEKRIL